MRAGVTAVKVVGREANTQRKLRSVQMVRAVIEGSALVGEDDVKAFAQGLRKKPEYCRSGYMCYYRDVLDPRGARM
jgi:putative protease